MNPPSKNTPPQPVHLCQDPTAPAERDQHRAFATLAAARRALRTSLHACLPVVEHILALARECATGAVGTKNIAKKYFEASGPDTSKIRACELAPGADSLSDALHALEGKPALYAECLLLAKNLAYASPLPLASCDCPEKLAALETAYVAQRNHIVRDNLRLAASVAHRFGTRVMTEEDLQQHAAIALQKAVETFKPALGNQFSTYAFRVIKGELIRTCENSSHQIRLPSHVWVRMRKYNETRERLAVLQGYAPTRAQMAAELGITLQEVAQLQQYHCKPVSMSSPLNDGPDAMTLGDTLADDGIQTPGYESGNYADFIAPYAGDLNTTERCILRKWVGDGPCLQMAKEDIAAELGLTLEVVTRKLLHSLAKVKLRKESPARAA